MERIFHTTTDSEVIAFHIARERVHSKTVEEAVFKNCQEKSKVLMAWLS